MQKFSIFDLVLPSPEGTPSGRYRFITEEDGTITQEEMHLVGDRGSVLFVPDWRKPFSIKRSELNELIAKQQEELQKQQEALKPNKPNKCNLTK